MNMHRLFVAVLALCLAGSHPAAAGGVSSLASDVASMTNDDIRWDGNYFGLWPAAATERAKRIQAAGKSAIPLLRETLRDPRKYVAAHVFLTQLSGKPFQLSASEYNALVVTLYSDGRVVIPDQRTKISRLWALPRKSNAKTSQRAG
jgi:hypothetical protein